MDEHLIQIDMGEEEALFSLMQYLQAMFPIETARIASHIQDGSSMFSRAAINKAICFKYKCLEYCRNESNINEIVEGNVICVQDIINRIDAVVIWIPLVEDPSKLPSRYLDTHVEFNIDDVDLEEQKRLWEQAFWKE